VIGECENPVRAYRQRRGRTRRRSAAPSLSRAGFLETPTYDRPALKAGNRIAGPALSEEHASTTVAHPGDAVEVDAFGDLVITIRRG
jgi:N-methylhydantoinase A/oxoprolinase/acetone carboxylase beta subunit